MIYINKLRNETDNVSYNIAHDVLSKAFTTNYQQSEVITKTAQK